MAKIQWPNNPQIGDTVSAYFGGAWVWDGCMWKHTCCPTEVCDYEANDGINMLFVIPTQSNPGGPIVNVSIYFWLQYIGSYSGGKPKFSAQILGAFLAVEWDGTQWTFIGTDLFDEPVISGTAPELTGPWTLINYSSYGQSLQFECGPYVPRCIHVVDSVNGYEESLTWIPVVFEVDSTEFFTYAQIGESQTAISGQGDVSLLLDPSTNLYKLDYTYYYLSPGQTGFEFDLGAPMGTANKELPLGTFTYNSYGENITFTITEAPGYTCYPSY